MFKVTWKRRRKKWIPQQGRYPGPRKDYFPVPLLVTESLPQTRPGLGIEVLVLNRDRFDFNQKVGDLSQCNISTLMRKPGQWALKEGRNPNLNEGAAPEKES